MLQTSQWSRPQGLPQGRSRFSKALPAPPPVIDTSFSTTSAFPSRDQSLPRPPKLADTDSPKLLDSPLPPLPLQTLAKISKMSIPRRPVGLPTSPFPGHRVAPHQVSQQQSPAPPLSPPQTQDLDIESPGAVSISSIISAYTATSIGSTQRSSDSGSSARSSDTSFSPQRDRMTDVTQSQQAPVIFPPRRDSRRQAPSLTKTDKSLPVLPPNPVNEVDEQSPLEAPGTNFSGPTLFTTDPTSSPPRPELWKRRSAIKPENHLALPDLKLANSHGSTVSPLLRSAAAPAPAVDQSNLPAAQLPRPGNSLPGRNIRPVASRPAPAPPQFADDSMGQKGSKFQQQSLSSEKGLPPAPSSNNPITPNIPMSARPPTPEYDPMDVQTPVLETVMSPVSPASSPEPAPRPSKQTVNRKPVGTDSSVVHPVRSSSTQASSPPLAVAKPYLDGVRPGASNIQQQQIKDANTGEIMIPGRPPLHHRDASLPRANPEQPANPAIRLTDAAGTMQREVPGLQTPIKIEQEVQQNFVETSPYSPGVVLDAPSLHNGHLNCYKQHKFMRQSPNLNYPLGCQACKLKDREMRWRCDWCCLRICRKCLDGLSETKNRDLGALLAKINEMEKAPALTGLEQS